MTEIKHEGKHRMFKQLKGAPKGAGDKYAAIQCGVGEITADVSLHVVRVCCVCVHSCVCVIMCVPVYIARRRWNLSDFMQPHHGTTQHGQSPHPNVTPFSQIAISPLITICNCAVIFCLCFILLFT